MSFGCVRICKQRTKKTIDHSRPTGHSETFNTSTSRCVDPDPGMQVMNYIHSPGQTPWSLNGMSSWFTINPQTPFCPCLLENLSPNSGLRVCLMSTFIKVWSLSVSVIMTLSICPGTGDLYAIGEFLYDTAEACPVNELSLAFVGVCLLIYTSPGSTRSPTPARPSGWMISYFLWNLPIFHGGICKAIESVQTEVVCQRM
jgi:hypothetical protein